MYCFIILFYVAFLGGLSFWCVANVHILFKKRDAHFKHLIWIIFLDISCYNNLQVYSEWDSRAHKISHTHSYPAIQGNISKMIWCNHVSQIYLYLSCHPGNLLHIHVMYMYTISLDVGLLAEGLSHISYNVLRNVAMLTSANNLSCI